MGGGIWIPGAVVNGNDVQLAQVRAGDRGLGPGRGEPTAGRTRPTSPHRRDRGDCLRCRRVDGITTDNRVADIVWQAQPGG